LAVLRNAVDIPLLAEEGWTRQLIEAGAPGAKREPDRAKPQLMVSSGKLFRPKHFAELTTITASRYRARASPPSAASSVASRLLLMPQPSPSSARRGISRTQLLANSFTPSMTAHKCRGTSRAVI